MSFAGLLGSVMGSGAEVVGRQAVSQQQFDLEQEKQRLAEDRALRLEEMKYSKGVERKKSETSAVMDELKRRTADENANPVDEGVPRLPGGQSRAEPKKYSDREKGLIARSIAREMGYDESAYDRDVKQATDDENRDEDRQFKREDLASRAEDRKTQREIQKGQLGVQWAQENRNAAKDKRAADREEAMQADADNIQATVENIRLKESENDQRAVSSLTKHLERQQSDYAQRYGTRFPGVSGGARDPSGSAALIRELRSEKSAAELDGDTQKARDIQLQIDRLSTSAVNQRTGQGGQSLRNAYAGFSATAR